MAAKKSVRRAKVAEPAAAVAHSTDAVSQLSATTEDTAPAEAAESAKPEKVKGQKDKKKKDKKKKNKEAVMIRFEKDQLGLIDARADALGLSRAAWVRMVVAQVLAQA